MGKGDWEGVRHRLTGLSLGDSEVHEPVLASVSSAEAGAVALRLSDEVPVWTRGQRCRGESREIWDEGLVMGINGDSTRSKKSSSQTDELILGVVGFECPELDEQVLEDSFFNKVRWSSNSVELLCWVNRSLTE